MVPLSVSHYNVHVPTSELQATYVASFPSQPVLLKNTKTTKYFQIQIY